MSNYTCSALVNDRYCEDTVQAVSEKQAWYKFAKKYGFRMRNFTVIGKTPVAGQALCEQIKFNI
nr:MAG TPA: hypothetical protein [Caudoviricetes sp.]